MLTIPKNVLLKKRFIKSVVIVFVINLVVAGGAFFVANYDDDLASEVSQKEGENSGISSQYNQIMNDINLTDTMQKFYKEYSKNHNPDFTISRDLAVEMIRDLCKKNHVKGELTPSDISELTDTKLDLRSGKADKMLIRMSVGAVSDSSIYNLIYDLQHQMPGIVLLSELKLERAEELSRNTLLTVADNHVILPIVKGELTFAWIGIAAPAETKAGGANNAK